MGFADDLKGVLKNAVRTADDPFWETDLLPTGIAPIDHILGGGFGFGRVSEIFGNYSSGKTLVLYKALARNQQMGGESVLFETEGAFNADFYASMGGNPKTLLVPNPSEFGTVEKICDGIVKLAKMVLKAKEKYAKVPIAIGWDGIAATATDHLLDVGMEKRDMSKASAMNQGTQLIANIVKQCRIAVIATNQTREKIGSMDSATHTPGGHAWPFLSSQRLELQFDGGSKTSMIVDNDNPKLNIGRWIRCEVVKNKLAPPWGKCVLPFYALAGLWHPEGYGYATRLGIDIEQALFYMYLRGTYVLPSTASVITQPTSGWYEIAAEVDPNCRKFRKKEWPTVLQEIPKLYTLVYDVKSGSSGKDTGELPSTEADESGSEG